MNDKIDPRLIGYENQKMGKRRVWYLVLDTAKGFTFKRNQESLFPLLLKQYENKLVVIEFRRISEGSPSYRARIVYNALFEFVDPALLRAMQRHIQKKDPRKILIQKILRNARK